jgi:hypothetical protein
VRRPAKRILGQDGGRPQRPNARPLPPDRGFGLDVFHQGRGPLVPLLRRQVPPTGERIELQYLSGGILEAIEVLSAAARRVFLGAVEPEAFQDFAFDERPDGMDSGPVPRPFDQILRR